MEARFNIERSYLSTHTFPIDMEIASVSNMELYTGRHVPISLLNTYMDYHEILKSITIHTHNTITDKRVSCTCKGKVMNLQFWQKATNLNTLTLPTHHLSPICAKIVQHCGAESSS